MSSKRSSSIMDGTIRSISGPGRWTRTDLSLPISEVTLRVIQARKKKGRILPDRPSGAEGSNGLQSFQVLDRKGSLAAAPRGPASRGKRQEGGRGGSPGAPELSESAVAFSATASRRVVNR